MWKLIRRRTIDMTYGDSPCPRAHYNLNNNPIIRRARLLNVRTPYPTFSPRTLFKSTSTIQERLCPFSLQLSLASCEHSTVLRRKVASRTFLETSRILHDPALHASFSLPFWNGIEILLALRFRDSPPEVLLLGRRLLKKKK